MADEEAFALPVLPETILGITSGIIFVVTLLNRAWIETVFNVDLDQGQG